MAPLRNFLSWALLAASSVDAISTSLGVHKTIGEIRRELESNKLSTRAAKDLRSLYTAHTLTTPIDHFHNESRYEPHSDGTFPLQYWFDASNYSPGGPVIILQGGETDGYRRLPYMQKGILAQLAQATKGIAVVLEHRYYGASYPMPDLSAKSLRFLSTEQAMADQAYFAQNIVFPGLEKYGDLTSKTTAYIAYGGSYAGAFSAFLRVQYPDVFWGSISSSGVTKAIVDYWQYYDQISKYAPKACIAAQKSTINLVDTILLGKKDPALTKELKETFGYGNVTHEEDFAQQLVSGIVLWQNLNWDPAVTDDEFYRYCDNVTATDILYPETSSKRSAVDALFTKAGLKPEKSLTTSILNMIGYLKATSTCDETTSTQDECYDYHDPAFYQGDTLKDTWRTWPYQVCTEWGYFQGGNVPKGQLPIVSKALTTEYQSIICREAFNITTPPKVELVNKYGGYGISYPRLAIVDGEWDPWRAASPNALEYGAKDRKSTVSEPFFQIDNAVHHWDENGLFPNETTADLPPGPVVDAQKKLAQAVQQWMVEWKSR